MATIISPQGRFCFPDVYRPTKIDNQGEARYRITLAFAADADLTEMKAEATRVAQEKWGKDMPKNLATPFKLCADHEGTDYGDAVTFVRLNSKKRPPVVGPNPHDELDEESGQVYGGCYGRVSCQAFAYDVGGNKGVAFGLQSVQKLCDGEPFGASADPVAEFGDENSVPAASGGMFA